MEAKAFSRRIRISPQKLRIIANLVRGINVDKALKELKFIPNKGALIISKIINSAVANFEHNYSHDIDRLYIKKIYIDGGPTMKRIRPMPMGRAGRILKRTSSINVVLSDSKFI